MIRTFYTTIAEKGQEIGVDVTYAYTLDNGGGGCGEWFETHKTFIWKPKSPRCSSNVSNIPSGQKLPIDVRNIISEDEGFAKKHTLKEFMSCAENRAAKDGACAACKRAAAAEAAAKGQKYQIVYIVCFNKCARSKQG